MGQLNQQLPAGNTVSVTNPGNQSTTTGSPVSLQVNGSSTKANPLSFTATGLPAGLSISSTGLITGTPSTAGTSSVTVSATDTTPGVSGTASFTWTVTTAVTGKPIKNAASGKCLDDFKSGTANGNDVDLWACNGTGAQQWTAAGNALKVKGKCLDNLNGTNGNGNEIVIWACNGSSAEVWVHQANNSYKNTATGKCLDNFRSGTANGNEINCGRATTPRRQVWVGP